MPTHSIGKNDQRDQYSRWRAIISKYNCDAICLAGRDHNNVINDSAYLGNISIVRGASPEDPTSLNRMASMFSSTHEMITDMIGSHIIYAAASGVSIRVLDEISEYYNASGDSSKLLNSIPKKVRQDFQKYYKDKSKNLSKILSSIWMTGNDLEIKEYSEYILGVEHRRSKDVIKSYLTPNSGIQKINIVSSLLLEKVSSRVWR